MRIKTKWAICFLAISIFYGIFLWVRMENYQCYLNLMLLKRKKCNIPCSCFCFMVWCIYTEYLTPRENVTISVCILCNIQLFDASQIKHSGSSKPNKIVEHCCSSEQIFKSSQSSWWESRDSKLISTRHFQINETCCECEIIHLVNWYKITHNHNT